MRIGILAVSTPQSGGVYQYAQTLIQALIENDGHTFYILKCRDFVMPFLKGGNYSVVDFEDDWSSSFWTKQKAKICFRLPYLRKLINASSSFKKIRNLHLDMIISPVVHIVPYLNRTPYCILISDLQHKYYPEFFTSTELSNREQDYRIASQYANMVMCESNFVKNDIQRFLGIPSKKIQIIKPPPFFGHNRLIDVAKIKAVREKYQLPEKFLFYPAQFWRHKNHIKLLEAVQLLKEHYHEEIFVIFVGAKQKDSEDYFERVIQQIKTSHLEKQVACLGYVSQEDILCLYKLATALVMPSLFESISLPIGEAFGLGVPVISSNVCALPQQVGDAGLLFDPMNCEDIANKVLQVWRDKTLRERLIVQGYEQVKGMTIENFGKQWEDAINLCQVTPR